MTKQKAPGTKMLGIGTECFSTCRENKHQAEPYTRGNLVGFHPVEGKEFHQPLTALCCSSVKPEIRSKSLHRVVRLYVISLLPGEKQLHRPVEQ